MSRYKLFRLLHLLEKQEQADLEKRLAAPGKEPCLRLLQSLKKLPPEKLEDPQVKQSLFRQVFPGEAYHDERMRKLMVRLRRQTEDFLVEKQGTTDPAARRRLLLASLKRRGDYGLFHAAATACLEELETQPLRDAQYFREKSDLLQALYFHPETSKFSPGNDLFEQSLKAGEWHFLLSTLLNGGEFLVRNKAVSSGGDFPPLDFALQQVEQQLADCPPVVLFFWRVVRLLRLPGEAADLQGLKAELERLFPQLSDLSRRMALKLLVNYAIPFSNDGSLAHNRFMFDLYQLGIEKKLLQQGNNALETSLFVNIAITAATAGELAWAADFIEKHSPLLPEEDRHNACHLCWGGWHYHKGLASGDPAEFDQALLSLRNIQTRSDEPFDLRVRTLQLRILFDTSPKHFQWLNLVQSQARNFKRHLENSPVFSEGKKEAYLHFIRYYLHLAKLFSQPKPDPGEVRLFLEAVQSNERCALRRWLQEKAEASLKDAASVPGVRFQNSTMSSMPMKPLVSSPQMASK